MDATDTRGAIILHNGWSSQGYRFNLDMSYEYVERKLFVQLPITFLKVLFEVQCISMRSPLSFHHCTFRTVEHY